MINQKPIDQADKLIAKGELVLLSRRASEPSRTGRREYPTKGSSNDYTDYGQWSEWRSQSLSFLRRTLGDQDTFATHFDERCINSQVSSTMAGLGVLRAVREDLAEGNLARLPELIRAEVFSDFLEMAEHLLASGYKDPAAVLGGGVLEEHLRLLCNKHNIPTTVGVKPKKADTMNADLAKAGAYDTNQLKIITAWLGTSNSAAHGDYGKYTDAVVNHYLSGIREFIARFPA
jgi:hypothetical protein